MKLATIAFLLLAGVPTLGQTPEPPQGHPFYPTLAECRSALRFLVKENPHFVALSVGDMQEYERAMSLCGMVDRENNYGSMKMLLWERVHNRMIEFVDKSGLWQSFLSWDADPRNRE